MELSEAAKINLMSKIADLVKSTLDAKVQDIVSRTVLEPQGSQASTSTLSPADATMLNTSLIPSNQRASCLRKKLFPNGMPPKFSGKPSRAGTWLRKYEQVCFLHGLTGNERLDGVGLCLEGIASDWFWSRVISRNQGKTLTWPEFREMFCDAFITEEQKYRLLQKICTRYQRPDETLNSYVYEIISMCYEYDDAMEETRVITYVTQNMERASKATVLAYLLTQGRSLDKLDEIVRDLSSEKVVEKSIPERTRSHTTSGLSSAQDGGEGSSRSSSSRGRRQGRRLKPCNPDSICYNCMKKGHYLRDCPSEKDPARVKKNSKEIKKKRAGPQSSCDSGDDCNVTLL